MSLAALHALGLDEVWWLVSPGNPLKPNAGMAPYGCFESNRRDGWRTGTDPCQYFRNRGRHAIHSRHRRHLAEKVPQHRFIWLMGEDSVAQFHQ